MLFVAALVLIFLQAIKPWLRAGETVAPEEAKCEVRYSISGAGGGSVPEPGSTLLRLASTCVLVLQSHRTA